MTKKELNYLEKLIKSLRTNRRIPAEEFVYARGYINSLYDSKLISKKFYRELLDNFATPVYDIKSAQILDERINKK